ncbi:helicase-related protein [Mesorhizobium sp. WSM4989]|nr:MULTISPECIES: helicase-related protein [unclassified Mesorhizobium]MDG4889988.1 helicase-related protein [Mesorhizobium sp. WSM4887]MDG4904130.1 helicase-related protein [Mesorhizobium sp. WSM4962]MDG4909157.1 helicase-related protein [Mesorhizobium sp. WSM4898]MDG4921781.1 helicase-related protein [Mesorhizobium sp. WSM4989]
MFATLRGANNLVFAGSRRRVEALADRLRTRSENGGVPNEFFPHHGSLSKELREELEDRLKQSNLPTTEVATTTLELGIDIGSIKSVAQVGAPRSLASLRQRLGRSGRRRGVPAILRVYVRERNLGQDSDPLDHLRLETVRAVAAVRLLVAKFVEPPSIVDAVATVALHQTVSLIAQEGGLRADRLFETICSAGPLSVLGKDDYIELLRGMASADNRLLEQAPDGTVMLGEIGERLTAGRDFYAVFSTDEEWRIVCGGRTLGAIPISNPVAVGVVIAFAGQRWRIASVDDRSKVLEVERHRSGKIPQFDNVMSEPVHDRLSSEMRAVLEGDDVPAYLDMAAADFLGQGREAYLELGLQRTRFLPAGKDTHILTWRGTEANAVLAFTLVSAGLECAVHDVGVTVLETTPSEAEAVLRQVAERPPDIQSISEFVENLETARFDGMVPEPLLRRLWAKARANIGKEIGAVATELLNPRG